jgi:Dyp-type peroxidase family
VSTPPFSDQQLHDIQGFGIGGFNKDHQELLFLRFGDPAAGRRLIGQLQPNVATAWEVGLFNRLFSEIKGRTGTEPLAATWLALTISAAGYQALGVSTTGLPAGEGTNAFNAGMAARAPQIGDTGPLDAPGQWLEPFRSGVHACIVVAADEPDDLDAAVTLIGEQVSAADATIVHQERGETLPAPLTGHEHFGFKDGISQPAIDGYDPDPGPNEPPAVPAGEFVLGFPNSQGANPSGSGSLWVNGSFIVFRRLHQDVAGFRQQASAGIPGSNPALNAEQTAAAFVGRWPSGAPLETNPTADPGSPGPNPNAFQFRANDDAGLVCPHFAHIRKANPRDETTPSPADNPADHRMLRRGIPYGPPLPDGVTSDDGVDRGLLFFCVICDPNRQFEFVQQQWLNSPNFPNGQAPPSLGPYGPPASGNPDGPDPVVGEHPNPAMCLLVQASGQHPFNLSNQVVRLTGGEYFFLPSLSAISAIAGGASS